MQAVFWSEPTRLSRRSKLLGGNRLWCFRPEQERLGNLAQPEYGFGRCGRAENSALAPLCGRRAVRPFRFPKLTAGILGEQMQFPDVPALGFVAHAQTKALHHPLPVSTHASA